MDTIFRNIGNASVPAIGFGAMGISIAYGPTESDEERFKILDAAYAQGCTHWDTAYAYGDSEELIGKWFKRTGKRDDIFLATKGGIEPTVVPHGDPEYINGQFATSLKRLGVDSVDLYYVHRIDPNVPIEITIGALTEHVKAGKIKYLGLSECSARTLRRAHAVHPITAIQIEFSPFALEITDPKIGLLATARELGVKIVAYSPLGRGLLSGQIKTLDDLDKSDLRRLMPNFSATNFPKIVDIASRLKEVGEAKNASAAQVTLAWILAQGDDFHVIPGTKKIKYLNENLGAASVKLTPEEVAAVQKIVDVAKLPNERYDPHFLQYAFGDSAELN